MKQRRILLAPYNMGSAGAKALAQAIGAKRTKAEKRFGRGVTLVNWGRSDLIARGFPKRVLNPANAIIQATDKLKCLNRLAEAGVSRVEHTTNMEIARQWTRQGFMVYGRKLLNASQGKGIILISNERELVACPMYTKGIAKSHEYRVHVFQGQILDVTKKRRRNQAERSDFIKNLANGWVYCREGIEIPENLLECAKNAVTALGLDFGAVDLLYRQGVPYVLEINTAPGLQGTTLTKYVQAFSQLKG